MTRTEGAVPAPHGRRRHRPGRRRSVPSARLANIEAVPGYSAPTGAQAAKTAPLPIDAWYSLHPDSALTSALQTGDVAEVTFGADDRKLVADTTVPPYCWVALLEIEAGDGSQWRGTGWLAGPRLIMTAGHCVFMPAQGGWVQSVAVTLGAEPDGAGGVKRPFGTQTSSELRSVAGWVTSQDDQHDYGAVLLPESLDTSFGSFSWAALSDGRLGQATVNIDGYPADKPSDGQYFSARALSGVTPTALLYENATYGGDSGAPAYVDPDDRTVVGMHTRGLLTSNEAVRITDDVASAIDGWRTESGG